MPVFGGSSPTTTTTLNDLIEDVRHTLYSGQVQETNWLSASVQATDTNIPLLKTVGSGAIVGSIVAVDLEEMQVQSSSGSTLTVVRGVNGSTPAAHVLNAQVEILPKFSRFRIMQIINQDLDDLSSVVNGLFQILTVDINYNPVLRGYDMTGVTPSNVLAIQEVLVKRPDPTKYWPPIKDCRLARNMAASEFPSGLALFLYEERGWPGLPMHVKYRAPFTHFTALTDDAQAVAGLPATANDLPALGAAVRLAEPREIARNFLGSQRDPMLLETVPAGATLRAYQGLALRRSQRIVAEASRLERQYGQPIAA